MGNFGNLNSFHRNFSFSKSTESFKVTVTKVKVSDFRAEQTAHWSTHRFVVAVACLRTMMWHLWCGTSERRQFNSSWPKNQSKHFKQAVCICFCSGRQCIFYRPRPGSKFLFHHAKHHREPEWCNQAAEEYKYTQGIWTRWNPGNLLKEIAVEVSSAVVLLFQASIDQGKVPSSWEKALVSPIFKKGNRPGGALPWWTRSMCLSIGPHF